jgi:hypothetical protein
MYTKDHVASLVTELGNLKIDPPVEIESSHFGLSAHAFDPVSGQIITLAQPHRVDIGQPAILLTPKQAAEAVAALRAQHLHNVRAAGYASIHAYNEAMKRDAATAELAHKQAIERAKMDETHAEATAKAAADAQPKKDAPAAAKPAPPPAPAVPTPSTAVVGSGQI